MSPSDLLELAERCERTSGADRELDRVIHGDVLGFCLHPHERLERTGMWPRQALNSFIGSEGQS